ncbi:MAG: tetratricopeptide repeat protein, partial [Acidobacteriia bacterium]|nr:tetratricopeptide repeat protein [Terriglobia bacterium]
IGLAIAVAALASRVKQPRIAYAVLGVVVALFGARTWARNPVWASDVTLGESGMQSAPRSFRTHELLARGLFRASAPGHLERRVITEAEAAWNILRPLPPERSFYQTPGNLGMYYQIEGDSAGGASTPQGRVWYEKSVAMLENAARIAQATEKSHDAAQKAHGKPLPPRMNMTEIYFNLGAASAKLGRYEEALRAYRYARDLNPSDPEVYDALSAVYISQENWRQAAIVLEEKTQVDGFKPQTVRNIAGLYGKVPGGSCAVMQSGPELKLNPGCQAAWEDLCAAWADLGQSFARARQPDAAHFLKDRSVNKYSCPAEPFSKLP